MSEPRVAVVVQARCSSRRLPGKVLLPLQGAPCIVRMLQRVQRVRRAHLVRVATSVSPDDDALAQACEANGIDCVRGSLDDVLGRLCAAVPLDYDVVVRLTGDCPLIDPAIVDAHIAHLLQHRERLDFVSNGHQPRTQPDGLDVEVMGADILRRAAGQAQSSYDREHVTPWVLRHGRSHILTQAVDLSALRWTLDTQDDYRAISDLYDRLYPQRPDFGTEDIYRLLMAQPAYIRTADSPAAPPPDVSTWVRRIGDHLAHVG